MRMASAPGTFRLCLAFVAVIVPLSWQPSLAYAQDRFTISPYVGAHFADEDRRLPFGSRKTIEDGPVFGLRVGIPFSGPWSAELTYGRTSFEVRHRVPTIEDPEGILARDMYDLHIFDATLHEIELSAGATIGL